MSACKFDLAWRGPCGEPISSEQLYGLSPSEMCDRHEFLTCRKCKRRATRECDETYGPFCCGEPLCNNCRCTMGGR